MNQYCFEIRFGLPSTAARNELHSILTTKEGNKYIANGKFVGEPVEAHKPKLRSDAIKMNELIKAARKYARRNRMSLDTIKETLPIDTWAGTVTHEGRVVARFDEDKMEAVFVSALAVA